MAYDRDPGVRWWPVLLILLLAGAALAALWLTEADNRQNRVLATVLVAVVSLALLLLWTLFFSRLRWSVRLSLVLVLLVLAGAGRASLRVRGVSGDLVPILAWRWEPQPGTDSTAPGAAARLPGTSALPETLAHAYPQFLGPRRDGTVDGPTLARDWIVEQPEAIWRRTVGSGWSGFAVAGGLAVTQEQRGDREMVVAYDVRTGEPRWTHADAVRWDDPLGGAGPRATPTIDDGTVYALGGTGLLTALDLATGTQRWQRDVMADSETQPPDYGVATSPLVVDPNVVVQAGGTGGKALVAYNRITGRPAWTGGNDPASYSSPFLADLAGVPQIVLLTGRNVVGHDPVSGNQLWAYPWPAETEKVSKPVVIDEDRLFVSTGYGIGGRMLRVGGDAAGLSVSPVWESRALKAKFTNVVLHRETLYGLDDGILAAVDVESGDRLWKGGRYGHGSVILSDDLLLIQAESGEVVLVAATREGHLELGRFQALNGKTWNHMALAGPYLFVRNDAEAACYRLPTRLPARETTLD